MKTRFGLFTLGIIAALSMILAASLPAPGHASSKIGTVAPATTAPTATGVAHFSGSVGFEKTTQYCTPGEETADRGLCGYISPGGTYRGQSCDIEDWACVCVQAYPPQWDWKCVKDDEKQDDQKKDREAEEEVQRWKEGYFEDTDDFFEYLSYLDFKEQERRLQPLYEEAQRERERKENPSPETLERRLQDRLFGL